MTTRSAPTLGVHSESGVLREVIVSAPGRAHEKLTPSNARELLFDDVLWVEQAQRDHHEFVDVMRERGVIVDDVADLLAETVHTAQGREWVLSHMTHAGAVGVGVDKELTAWLKEVDDQELAGYLIGGLSVADLPKDFHGPVTSAVAQASAGAGFVLPPLPNLLYARDTSTWFPGGVALNSLRSPARAAESQLYSAIYQFHPRFAQLGAENIVHTAGHFVEGGDIMFAGERVALMGMGGALHLCGCLPVGPRVVSSWDCR